MAESPEETNPFAAIDYVGTFDVDELVNIKNVLDGAIYQMGSHMKPAVYEYFEQQMAMVDACIDVARKDV